MPKNINCFTIIITLEGGKKINLKKYNKTVWTKKYISSPQKVSVLVRKVRLN